MALGWLLWYVWLANCAGLVIWMAKGYGLQ